MHQDTYPCGQPWPKLPPVYTGVFGRAFDISKDVLLWINGVESIRFTSFNDITEACRTMHKKTWNWVHETGGELKHHKQIIQLYQETGFWVPNYQFACLAVSVERKWYNNDQEFCSLCPISEMKCDSQFGWFGKYRYTKHNSIKRDHALAIANGWERRPLCLNS